MGNEPSSAMDARRLRLFHRALREMSGDIITDARWSDTVCADLGLVESQAIDVINRFFTFVDDVMYLVHNGFVQAAPDEDDPEVMHQLLEMFDHGLIERDPRELYAEDVDEADIEPDDSMIVNVPICRDGVAYLELAVHAGSYVQFYITPRTTVGDVIEFVKAVERMEIPPRLITQASIDLAPIV